MEEDELPEDGIEAAHAAMVVAEEVERTASSQLQQAQEQLDAAQAQQADTAAELVAHLVGAELGQVAVLADDPGHDLDEHVGELAGLRVGEHVDVAVDGVAAQLGVLVLVLALALGD